MKNKYLFLGDPVSINIELICNSHRLLKNKINYIILGRIKDLEIYKKKINCNIKIKEVFDPINFDNLDKNSLNIFNIDDVSIRKYENLLNQILISNNLSNKTKIDLVTMPIDKSVFKKNVNFTGMTEFLSKINKRSTLMMMLGEKFSVVPLTTHINLKEIHKFIERKKLNKIIKELLNQIDKKIYGLKFNQLKFLCYNPHCSENNTIGNEDKIIYETISKFKNINGLYPADSAFNNKDINNTLFISMYHDQALIPFKILNKKGINLTLGLDYKRISPAHGTARDIIFKNKSDNSSYIECMKI